MVNGSLLQWLLMAKAKRSLDEHGESLTSHVLQGCLVFHCMISSQDLLL